MLDSGSSHNLMQKVVMEILGLEIKKTVQRLVLIWFEKIQLLGQIKDLYVNLAQVPAKHLVMDIVIEDIPPKYIILLSRSWGAKLQGNIQLDTSYATIPVFN